MTKKRIGIMSLAAALLVTGLACGGGETVGQSCSEEGKYRTRRTGHGIVHDRCQRDRGAPGLHWHEDNATPPAPRR